MAWSPYGKEYGGQWLDDVPFRSGVPLSATSQLEKFEAPDPAYWVQQGVPSGKCGFTTLRNFPDFLI